MKTLLSILLSAVLMTACNNAPAPTGILSAEQLITSDQLVSRQQFLPVSIAIAVINDISGSYKLNPESVNLDAIYKAMPFCSGRVVLGYTHIDEDSYMPIIRYPYVPRLLIGKPKDNESLNPWIQSEEATTDNIVFLHANASIDSLNNVSLTAFSSKVADKLNRSKANQSDVVFALKRASTFLNENTDSQRILVVCSDFADTYGRSMTLDPSIILYIVGSNVNPKHVKAATGIGSGYRLFESYEEAFNQIAQQYMYNSKNSKS